MLPFRSFPKIVKKKMIWLNLILFGIFGCSQKYSFRDAHPEVVKMDDIPADILLPEKLWDLLNASLLGGAQSASGGGGGGHGAAPAPSKSEGHEAGAQGAVGHGETEKSGPSSTADIIENQQKFLLSKVDVLFKEKNPEVLKQPSFRVEFSKGGGAIDFSQFIGKEKGTFFIGFEFPEWTDATDFKAYFVSRYQKRRISGEVHGVGCNKILDITNAFLHHMKTEGLTVNTTHDRHLNVIGGSFIFSARKNKDTFLAQVTLGDSQKLSLACPENIAAQK